MPPPELSGFYMGQSGTIFSKDYSFQFDQGSSDVYGEDAPYILRTRFTLPGQQQEIWRDWVVPDEEWDAFAAFVEEIDLEDQLYGRTEKPACTLYYSDGKQQQKKLDRGNSEADPGLSYRNGTAVAGRTGIAQKRTIIT